jgi:dynein heavy chain
VYRRIQLYQINPKSITSQALYGQYLEDESKTWVEGILVKAIRSYLDANLERGQLSDYAWIVFDGPVDAVWIENMNTVLDDNRKLCLHSGEIIKLTPFMSTLFECESLEHASPATVSRCGMVYLGEHTVEWQVIVHAFFVRPQVQEVFFDKEERTA